MVKTELIGRLRSDTHLCFEGQNHGLNRRKTEALFERDAADKKVQQAEEEGHDLVMESL